MHVDERDPESTIHMFKRKKFEWLQCGLAFIDIFYALCRMKHCGYDSIEKQLFIVVIEKRTPVNKRS